ncbi:MAG: RNA polymerase sigma factor [Actinomycetota bacterium]|nr:RNA polymerase sigma factor [Actinomycetota bacterium]
MAQLIDEVDPSVDTAELQERDLVARLRSGDEPTFAQLVDEWSPVMLHVARRYVANTQAAEDVVQEAWLGVIRGLPRFEGRSSLRSWTFSIVINRAKTRRTRDFRLVPSATMTAPESDGPVVDPARFQGPDGRYPGHWTSAGAPRPWEEPEGRALGREIGDLIDRALDELPERQRLVVQMRDVQGMSSDETCAALQLSQQNQRVLLHRGRSALRAALEGYYVD